MDKNKRALKRIKEIVDAYVEGRILITIGKQDFDWEKHTYDLSAVMAIIGIYASDALNDEHM